MLRCHGPASVGDGLINWATVGGGTGGHPKWEIKPTGGGGGQMFEDTTSMLSKRQCSFRKCLSTQHCLLVMRKKWGKSLDKGDICRAILTDILKAFVCIFYDRSITKLATYCFDSESPESWRVFFPIDNKKVNNTFS